MCDVCEWHEIVQFYMRSYMPPRLGWGEDANRSVLAVSCRAVCGTFRLHYLHALPSGHIHFFNGYIILYSVPIRQIFDQIGSDRPRRLQAVRTWKVSVKPGRKF